MCRGPPAENVNAPVGNRTRVKPTLPEKGLRGLRRGLHHYTAWEGLTRPPRGLNNETSTELWLTCIVDFNRKARGLL